MFDQLKTDVAIVLYMALRPLILAVAYVAWFWLLFMAFPYLLRWFLWPLG